MQKLSCLATGLVWLLTAMPARGDTYIAIPSRNLTAGVQQSALVSGNVSTDLLPASLQAQTVSMEIDIYTTLTNWRICTLEYNVPIPNAPASLPNASAYDFGSLTSSSDPRYPAATSFLSNIPINFTIPASIGPAGAYYRMMMFFNIPPNNKGIYGQWDVSYSDTFFLSNSTIPSWSPYERPDSWPSAGGVFRFAGPLVPTNSTIPCSSLDCVRQCTYKHPAPTLDDSQDLWTYDQGYIDCATSCNGVVWRVAESPSSLGPKYTTHAASSLPTATASGAVPAVSAGPNTTCDAGQYMSPCGRRCCSAQQVCYLWGSCQNVSSDATDQQEGAGGDSSSTPSSTVYLSTTSMSPTVTGAAGARSSVPGSSASRLSLRDSQNTWSIAMSIFVGLVGGGAVFQMLAML